MAISKKPKKLSDIRRPLVGDFLNKKTRAIKPEKADKILNLKSNFSKNRKKKSYFGKVIFYLSLIILAVLVGFVGFNIYQFRNNIIDSLRAGLYDLREATQNFEPLKTDSARKNVLPEQKFEFNQSLDSFPSKFWPALKNSLKTYSEFRDITLIIAALFQQSAALLDNSTDLIFNQKGSELISEIEDIKKIIDEIENKNTELAESIGRINELSISDLDFYIPFQLSLNRYQKFLDSFLLWLKSQKERHLFVILQNPAVMRPTGGRIEAYADVVIQGGKITSINIHDISEIDEKLNAKIIPPKPLQATAGPFETADANWFFDFSESGNKILQFAEKSEMYKTDVFDGIIAVTPKIVSDILEIIGPVKLSGQNTEITADNFLAEIQKENRKNYQLEILKKLVPIMFEKMGGLDSSQKQAFFKDFSNWKKARDLQFYFRNPDFQKFFESLELAGRVREFSQDFYGDYLALVAANIGGGKTDIFIEQDLFFTSSISKDGLVANNIKITRTHSGNEGKYRFYRVPNQTYLKIFTPKSAQLNTAEGGFQKIITPFINYSQKGYLPDPLVEKTETSKKSFLAYPQIESFIEYGKNVFTTWLKTEAGETTTFKLTYSHRLPEIPKENARYQFIFESQPGVAGQYTFEISAPVGFIWKESGSPIFEYKGENISGSINIELTLTKQ